MTDPTPPKTIEEREADSQMLIEQVVEEARKMKAVDVRAYDVRKLTSYADFIMICSGTSNRHVRAVAETVIRQTRKALRRKTLGVEGLESGQWVLIDYGDTVAHVFLDTVREFYDLDRMWLDAERVEGQEPTD